MPNDQKHAGAALAVIETRHLIKQLVCERKYENAYNILLELLSQSPSDYEVLSQIAYTTYLMQLYHESLLYYKQCIEINNVQIVNSIISNWFSYHQYGKLLHFYSRDLRSAEKFYFLSMRLNSHNLAIYHDIAKLYIDSGEWSLSQRYFAHFFGVIEACAQRGETHSKRLRNIASFLPVAHFEYGKLLFHQLQRENQGQQHLEKAVGLQPKRSAYHFEYARMLKATHDFQKARQLFLSCVRVASLEKVGAALQAEYNHECCRFLTDCAKDTRLGAVYARRAHELQPTNAEYEKEYLALTDWNAYCEATMKHKKIIRSCPTGLNRGDGGDGVGADDEGARHREIYNSIKRDARRIKFDDSMQQFEGAQSSVDWDTICAQNDKYSSRILEFKSKFSVACQAQAEHDYALAKNTLESLICVAPEDGEIFGRYAFALAQLNNLREAETYYQKSLALSPRNYVTMYNYAFLLYYKLKRYDEAETLYKKCLKIKPNCAKALLNYARLLDTVKKKSLSEQYYRLCLSGSPNYDLCFYYFGCFLYRAQRYQEAKYFLRKAVQCWPHSHLHHFRLAVTCHILCEYSKCEHHLREALRIKPRFEAAIEAYQRYGYGVIRRSKHNNGKLIFQSYYAQRWSHQHSARLNQPNKGGTLAVNKHSHLSCKSWPEASFSSQSGTSLTAATTPSLTITDADVEVETQHLRMYDPVRQTHRFNIDEKWIDISRDSHVAYYDTPPNSI